MHDLKKEKENHNAGISPYAPEIIVSASRIGPDDQRYITDDKLYQKYTLLIKSTLPIDTWRDIYKLFVHPAGMYVAGEVQIVSIAEPDYLIMPPGIADSAGPQFTGVADVAIFEFNSTNQVVQQILPAQQTFTLAPIQLGQMQGGNLTLADFDTQFDTLAIGNNAGSQTFDADSVTGDSAFPKLSSNNQLLLNFSNDFF